MKNQNQVLPTARSINHRLHTEHKYRVIEAKKHRSFEDDANSIAKQLFNQRELKLVRTVNP